MPPLNQKPGQQNLLARFLWKNRRKNPYFKNDSDRKRESKLERKQKESGRERGFAYVQADFFA
jgi:hypothetical protein